MTIDSKDRKSLLLLSGGHNSSLQALRLSIQNVLFDCLHFREARSEGSKAFERAQEDASTYGSKLHIIDTAPLHDLLNVSPDQPLLGCSTSSKEQIQRAVS